MSSQISHVCQSASFHLKNISAVSKYLPKEVVVTAVISNVMSRLDTGNSLYAGICHCNKRPDSVTCNCKIQNLQLVQNNAARVVISNWRVDHITPVLKDLRWLPATQRIQYKILTIVYKCLHGMAPKYLSELIHVYKPTRSLRSQDKGLILVIPKTKLALSEQMFAKIGPTLWMSLPRFLRDCESLEAFKRHLKAHLFKQAYGD